MAQEGIFLMNQSREPSAGVFQLPQEFDREKYVAEWVKRGSAVDAKKLPQPVLGTNYGAEGWAVFTYPKEHRLAGRPAEVPTAKDGTYILMMRPKSVQVDVNAIYGNISKQHLVHQQAGDIITDPTGAANTDRGMLTDARIRQATGVSEFGGETLQIPMNQVRVASKVEAEPAARVSTEV